MAKMESKRNFCCLWRQWETQVCLCFQRPWVNSSWFWALLFLLSSQSNWLSHLEKFSIWLEALGSTPSFQVGICWWQRQFPFIWNQSTDLILWGLLVQSFPQFPNSRLESVGGYRPESNWVQLKNQNGPGTELGPELD